MENINTETVNTEVNEIFTEERIEQVSMERDLWKQKCMYALADFDNYKKNAIKDKQNLAKYGSEKIVKDILPIIDDFERSFEHLDSDTAKGITLIYNKFIYVLTNHGVKTFTVNEGDIFNEKYHEAISVIPASSEEDKGKIVKCTETGYILNDKVIRYAKVIVMN